jgi:pimeloyl-ACP methyl ester carboxylesterase
VVVTFGLVHGASHGAWCWDRLAPLLEERGHRVVVPDLPCEDPDAGLGEYADVVIDALDALDALGADDDVALVGHSLGGLVIPVVAERRPVRGMIFLCSVPTGPGPAIEADLADMVTTAFVDGARDFDEHGGDRLHPSAAVEVWYGDCTDEDAAWAVQRLRFQSRRPLAEPSPLVRWPTVPLEVVLGRDDACVRMAWAIPAARARLDGREPVLLPGGHSPFLARPEALAVVLDDVVRNGALRNA